ncbi:MAG: GtrA family protein [Muribaculaceae bacterium]|nr:GtrA family protein [Muribaculaceae bacterium]
MSSHRMARLRDKFLHSDGLIFTMLRSGASSQICGWIDMLVSFVSFSLLGLTPWLSTAIGAFVGGILNCMVNYRFTFHAKGVAWRAALTKFLFVWAGSLMLNSFGTQFIYYLMREWTWLKTTMGLGDDAIFLVARLSVSLVVSLGWNFLLQKNFVFRRTRLDAYILRFLNCFRISRHGYNRNIDNDTEKAE